MIPKNGMQTFYGHFDLDTLEGIDLQDIHYKLSRTLRFSGYNRVDFSVLDHLYFCLWLAERDNQTDEVKLAVFIHDFAEAYVGDIIKPLKRMMKERGLDIGEIEDRIIEKILEKENLDPTLYKRNEKIVKYYDLLSLAYEKKYTLNDDVDWGWNPPETSEIVWSEWCAAMFEGYTDHTYKHFYNTMSRLNGGPDNWELMFYNEMDELSDIEKMINETMDELESLNLDKELGAPAIIVTRNPL